MGGKRLDITAELRSKVETYAGVGLTSQQIAACIGVKARETVQRKFKKELALGRAKALGAVAGQLYKAAMAGEAWAVCFYLKTRGDKGQFKETLSLEHTGEGEGPIRVVSAQPLSLDEWDAKYSPRDSMGTPSGTTESTD